MLTEALTCPNCGAPLHVAGDQALALCVYCGANIRLTYAAPAAAPVAAQAAAPPTVHTVTESALSPDAINQLKQLLATGKRDEAIGLYQSQSHASPAEAEQALQTFGAQVASKVEGTLPLTPIGVLIFLAAFVAPGLCGGLAGLIGLLARPPQWLLAVVALGLLVIALVMLFLVAPRLWATLRFRTATAAPATVLKFTAIGKVGPAPFSGYVWKSSRQPAARSNRS